MLAPLELVSIRVPALGSMLACSAVLPGMSRLSSPRIRRGCRMMRKGKLLLVLGPFRETAVGVEVPRVRACATVREAIGYTRPERFELDVISSLHRSGIMRAVHVGKPTLPSKVVPAGSWKVTLGVPALRQVPPAGVKSSGC